jgi:hypothetical protein
MGSSIWPVFDLASSSLLEVALIDGADSDLVEMQQQFSRILIHTVGSSPGQFMFAIATGHETDANGTRALGGKQIPNTIANDDGI